MRSDEQKVGEGTMGEGIIFIHSDLELKRNKPQLAPEGFTLIEWGPAEGLRCRQPIKWQNGIIGVIKCNRSHTHEGRSVDHQFVDAHNRIQSIAISN